MKILVKNLIVKYGNFIAVNNLNLNVRCGEIVGVLGPNGSGKTSTLRAILGLVPYDGNVIIDGYPAGSLEAKRKIGWMPQGSPMYSNLTVVENLRFFARAYGIEKDVAAKRIDELLEFVELKNWRNKLVRNLSGGMKRRALLACVLIHNPEILILDEPTAGVDPEQRRVFWEYFKDFSKQGKAILITTHYLDEAEYCHRLVVLMNGRKISEGTPGEIKRKVKEKIVLKACEGVVEVLKSLNLEFRLSKNEIVVYTHDVDSVIPVLIKKLIEKGLDIESVDVKRATLEDALLELVRNAN